jgi:hypothetical protein
VFLFFSAFLFPFGIPPASALLVASAILNAVSDSPTQSLCYLKYLFYLLSYIIGEKRGLVRQKRGLVRQKRGLVRQKRGLVRQKKRFSPSKKSYYKEYLKHFSFYRVIEIKFTKSDS